MIRISSQYLIAFAMRPFGFIDKRMKLHTEREERWCLHERGGDEKTPYPNQEQDLQPEQKDQESSCARQGHASSGCGMDFDILWVREMFVYS